MAQYVDFNQTGISEYPNSFVRQGVFPLDKSSLYYSLEDAMEYARNGATAHVGQIIVVIDKEAETVEVYKIECDGSLSPIGSGGDSSTNVYSLSKTLDQTDEEVVKSKISQLISSEIPVSKGNIFIVETKEAEVSYEKIAYIVTETIAEGGDADSIWNNCEALNGRVDANKAIMTSNLVLTANIGVHTIDGSGSKTLETKGKSVKQVLDMICSEEKNPNITQPSVNLTSSSMGAKEVGEMVTPNYTASLNPGSYQFGPATGVTATVWTVTDTNDGSRDTASGSFDEFQVTDDTNYSITAKAQHTEGAVPKTNIGNDYPDGKIQAAGADNPKSKTLGTITGYRKMFYGFSTEQVGADGYNSALIRSLNGSKFSNNLNITVPPGKLEIIIACEATKANTLSIYSNTVFQNITATKLTTTVDVEGANGYTAKAYNVWHVKLGTAYSSNQSWSLTFK